MIQSLATTWLEVIVTDDQSHANHLKDTPKSFLEMLNKYVKDVSGDHRRDRLDELRIDIQRHHHLKV
jgi:hypothetical protein